MEHLYKDYAEYCKDIITSLRQCGIDHAHEEQRKEEPQWATCHGKVPLHAKEHVKRIIGSIFAREDAVYKQVHIVNHIGNEERLGTIDSFCTHGALLL